MSPEFIGYQKIERESMSTDQDKKITLQNLGTRLVESFKTSGDPKDSVIQWKIMVEHLTYCLSNYDHLTPEAQKVTDDLQEQLTVVVEEQMTAMPDTIEKRKMKRLSRGARGKRLFADGYIKVLETSLDATKTHAIYQKTRELFTKNLQIIMDLYQDITDNTLSGPAMFCKLSLLGICIDELLVAFHLSQRSYAGQSFSHIRTIQECLDLVELFNKEPKWAVLWTSDEQSKEIWRELKPSEVRKKLGKDEIFGKIYSLLSSSGSHPSFEMLRTRCRMAVKLSPKGNRQFSISVGGTPKTKEAIFAHVFVLLSMVMVLAQMANSFKKFLNDTEIMETLKSMTDEFTGFVIEFLVKPLEDAGRDMSDMKKSVLDTKEKLLKGCV